MADPAGEIKLTLQKMKELTTGTQFSYAVGDILKAGSGQAATREQAGECASCHAFAGVEAHRRDFGKLSDRAAQAINELTQLLHDDHARAADRAGPDRDRAAVRNGVDDSDPADPPAAATPKNYNHPAMRWSKGPPIKRLLLKRRQRRVRK